MLRQLYNIGEFQYVVDLYDAEIDLHNNESYKNFIMLRNFNITNNIVTDTDIYIIDTDTFDEFIKSLHYSNFSDDQYTTKLVFPITGASLTSYSELYSDFNYNFKTYSLYDEDSYQEGYIENEDGTKTPDRSKDKYNYGSDVYKLLDHNGEFANIPCNIARIYHPSTQKSLNGIVHINCYINNINFHFLCQRYSAFKNNSNTEFKVNNQIYSEYVDVLFPNIFNLFKTNESSDIEGKQLYSVYYKENINNVYSVVNENFMNSIRLNINDNNIEGYINDSNDQIVPLNLLIQPFKIIEEINPLTEEYVNAKLYLKQYKSIENNYITYPVNITLYPYSEIDQNTYTYLLDTTSNLLTNVYTVPYKFSIYSKFGFVNSEFSVITNFNYPNKEKWIEKYNGDEQKALLNAYKYFYNVKEDDYRYFWVNLLRIMLPDKEDEILFYVNSHWDDQYEGETGEEVRYKFKRKIIDEESGEEVWETVDDVTDDEKLARAIAINHNNIFDSLRDEEYEEEQSTPMNFIGYKIEIASDISFSNIIHSLTVNSSLDTLDSFSFGIGNIFNSWDEIPDNILIRISFIDRITGNIFLSNMLVCDNDQLKYMVVKDINTIFQLNYKNDSMKEIVINGLKNRKMADTIKEEVSSNINKDRQNILNEIERLSYISSYVTSAQMRNLVNGIFDSFSQKYAGNDGYIDKLIDIDTTPINFIDTINIVSTNTNDKEILSNNYKSKILFKPIFFKVNDLQNIKIRSNNVQNIGINLNQYLTKVESFKLKINGIEFVESGRNDVYVIFNVNSTMISGTSGKYDIINQDDEFISSGNWSLY